MKWIYMIVPATGALMVVLNVVKIFGRLSALFRPDLPAEGTGGNG